MLTLLVVTLAFAQAIDVSVTAVTHLVEPLVYANPSLNLKGTINPSPGHRLQVVVLAVGESGVFSEVSGFALLDASGAAYAPIGVGGGAHLIFPIARLPMGQEVGQILPTDAIVAVMRNSASSVTIEAGPKGTIALLFELPSNVVLKSLRLPDGTFRKLEDKS
jgi:hypothetical protein